MSNERSATGINEYRECPEIGAEEWRGYSSILTQPASKTPTPIMVDGPLMGNGDVGVTLAGPADSLDFYLSKNDFWYQTDTRHFDSNPDPFSPG